jgi:hypothetical protein
MKLDHAFVPTLLIGATLFALSPAEAQRAGAGFPTARVWVQNHSDHFRRGDRLDVAFSVSRDAYVAVIHVDSDGALDFLYPSSPWDVRLVRAGRTTTLPASRNLQAMTIRSRPGIGYLFVVAAPVPLDFTAFRSRSGGWDWGYAGRTVRGDPFLAFDQIARLLVPAWSRTPHVTDVYGYHVDGIHRYPSYVCSDQRHLSGWGWTPVYGSCARQDVFLRQHPYYYDTRRYRGDRRTVLTQYDRYDPRHGFKEDPRAPARGTAVREPQRGVTDWEPVTTPAGEMPRREPDRGSPTPAVGRTGAPAPAPGQGTASPPSREPVPAAAPQDRRNTTGSPPPAEPRERPTPSQSAPAARGAVREAAPAERPPATETPPATGRARPTPDGDAGSSGGAPARGRP